MASALFRPGITLEMNAMSTASQSSPFRPLDSGQQGASPSCRFPPSPQAIRALLSLAWRHPRSERPAWLRAEVGDSP